MNVRCLRVNFILRLICCNFARFITSARFNRWRSGGGTRLKRSSVCYTRGYVNWSKCLWTRKWEMAALGVEVPYISYEGHVPPSFREIHVPSERARPHARVWQLLTGNDKTSPLVKFWRESAWEVYTSQLTIFRVIQCVEFIEYKRYISVGHETVSSFEASVILVPPGTMLGEKDFTISTF